MNDLGIVIVNWNTKELLDKCLQTVFANHGKSTFSVIVVDNASTDGSADMVRQKYPAAIVIVNDQNEGYPAANNRGLRELGFHGVRDVDNDAPRYALLLNPDTELPQDALDRVLEFMDSRLDVGVMGPKLVLEDGSLDKACRRSFPTPTVSFYHFSRLSRIFPDSERFARYNMTYADPDMELEVDSVVGAFMLVRREAIEQAGLLDEVFFMYAEDLDWAYRIKQAGWKVWYYPSVTVRHVKRAASSQSKRAQIEFWRAMLIFYRKHYQKDTPRIIHGMILSALLARGGRSIWREIRQPSLPQT